jgi:hypothetical protein
MMHPACSIGGRRLRFRGAGIKVIPFAVAALLASSSMVQAATCLASASEVRKEHPHAWPKWTYGPQGERCWYSGQKPVFAREPLRLVPTAQAAAVAPPKPRPAPETNAKSTTPIAQPWALEHRWGEIFRYPDPPAR